jgi:hypothetical protein
MAKRDGKEDGHRFISREGLKTVKSLFSDLPFVYVEPVGEAYAQRLLNSNAAIIYSGYNSLMDVAAARALVKHL